MLTKAITRVNVTANLIVYDAAAVMVHLQWTLRLCPGRNTTGASINNNTTTH